jgi:hypothetical protein
MLKCSFAMKRFCLLEYISPRGTFLFREKTFPDLSPSEYIVHIAHGAFGFSDSSTVCPEYVVGEVQKRFAEASSH